MQLFLDESGDWGYKSGSSRWFIFCAVAPENHRQLEKLIRKIRSLPEAIRNATSKLYAHNSSPKLRESFLKGIANLDGLLVFVVAVDKSKVPLKFRQNKEWLYNYTVMELLKDILVNYPTKIIGGINVCLDQRETNKNKRNKLDTSIKQKTPCFNEAPYGTPTQEDLLLNNIQILILYVFKNLVSIILTSTLQHIGRGRSLLIYFVV